MTSFQAESLVALPMQPSIRIRIGPDESIDVAQAAWESQKEDFCEWALSLPNVNQGLSWRLLKPYTGNNGMLAKLTIALGDFAKIWKMYPHPDRRVLWGKTHPSIVEIKTRKDLSRVPKPSAGDLDSDKHCTCCLREMGSSDSAFHDLVASDDTEGLCLECDLVCGPKASDCQLGVAKEKRAQQRPIPQTAEQEKDELEDNVVSLDAVEFENYAGQFSE